MTMRATAVAALCAAVACVGAVTGCPRTSALGPASSPGSHRTTAGSHRTTAGSHRTTAGSNRTTADSPTTPGNSPALDGCFTASSGRVEFAPDAGGGTLPVGMVGSGQRVIILSNESDEDLCSWIPLARRLAAAGYRTVLWDYAAGLQTDELRGLVRWLRANGVKKIVLMGASEGAKVSIVAAATARTAPSGVVSLSAEQVLLPAIAVITSVRRLHCPLLLVTASGDPYGSAQAAREFMKAAPSPDKQLVTVRGADHGTALLSGSAARTVEPAVLAFLRHVLRAQ
jgi:pimeloyl-ACP methyl ester carboxylesterase